MQGIHWVCGWNIAAARCTTAGVAADYLVSDLRHSWQADIEGCALGTPGWLCCYRLACVQDFFAYDPTSGRVSPCSEESSGMLVCSQLTELVNTAADFCKAAGEGLAAQHCTVQPNTPSAHLEKWHSNSSMAEV